MFKHSCKRSEGAGDIEFFINGEKHTVSHKFSPDTSLNDYIRDVAGLKGTKVMCKEAGCGCCAVAVTRPDKDKKAETMSINSCLCPLYSVDGWQISTVEGIGNSKDGFHPIQERLAKYSGTQCGYCSPGFVMSMYGLMHQNPQANQQEIEDSFDGHICRCTGYRPILDAMKSFASDSTTGEKALDIECTGYRPILDAMKSFASDSTTGEKALDIEDINKHLCPKTGEVCQNKTQNNKDKGTLPRSLNINLNDYKWYRPLNLKELSNIVKQHKNTEYKMFYGNTASGIFKHEDPFEVTIDLKSVKELHMFEENDAYLLFGGGTTITQLKKHLGDVKNKPGFHYCERVVKHLKFLASVLVRNAGSIAGNLMIKHNHPEFPSDLFTITEAVGAKVHVYDLPHHKTTKVTLLNFLQTPMKDKVLTAVEMPRWKPTDHYRSFKITPRSQNAHAYINAAFKIPVKDRRIIERPNIVIGGINGTTVHGTKTEDYLTGKDLSDKTIHEAVCILSGEANPSDSPVLAKPKCRKDLTANLLFKTLLEVYKPTNPAVQSAADSLHRPLSSGLFTFQEKPEEFPMKQSLPKKTAPFQASGEAEFIGDIPTFQHELAAALVGSTIASGQIKHVDISEAMQIPGVVRFIGVKDIPSGGCNVFGHVMLDKLVLEVFCEKDVGYEGQTVGLILAETQAIAEKAARKVKIVYENVKTPIIDLEEAIEQKQFFEGCGKQGVKGDVEAALKGAAYTVEGTIKEGTQYHFFMETITGLTKPTEDGLDLYITTQAPSMAHEIVSKVIGKPANYINLTVPRLGGSFGGKVFNALRCASMCAVATEKTKRPVRLAYDISSNMKLDERRFPVITKYKAGCDASGKMLGVILDIYVESGYLATVAANEFESLIDQGFYVPNWKWNMTLVKTNKSLSGACRSPGSLPAALIIETILEHLAKTMGRHPILFKEINLYEEGQEDHQGKQLTDCSLRTLWHRLKQTADVPKRMEEVDTFNKNNLWRKKGITMCACKYRINYFPMGFPTTVSVFAGDGTVTVCTAGVEMGQGLYMKVAQAVAKTLGVSLDTVKVRPTENNFFPNACVTGGSMGSERCVASAVAASQKIMDGLQPLREKHPGLPFDKLLMMAVFGKIPLYATGDETFQGSNLRYFTYMTAALETEVDILTGEHQVSRVDIMADFGESLNPMIDLGQVEGSFVTGLGAFLSEDHIFDKETGRMLNDGTWEYKPPTTKDIPIDWRVHFLPDCPNPNGILSSKATGEPPTGLSAGALLSIKASVEHAMEQFNGDKRFLPVEAPFTVEKVQQASNICVQNLHADGLPPGAATRL